MTRLLSDLLDTPQPAFGHRIRQLERAAGDPGTDIRLTAAILQRTQNKLRELGLDPQDTTGPELYQALQQRLLADEQRLREHLGLGSDITAPEVLSKLVQFVDKLAVPRNCFALKASVAKRLLKKLPPKKAMRDLGYRSTDSLVKHEPVAQIYAAAALNEGDQWHQNFVQQYAQVGPSDFESRRITLQLPRARRWEHMAESFAKQRRHTSITFKELGAVVILPVRAEIPALALTSTLLLLDGINTIRCASTYLKLHQVGMDFGTQICRVATGEPLTAADFAGQPLPWRLVQRYYHTMHEAYHPALFEPHVQPEDLALAEAEAVLAEALPALAFWQDTAGLAHVQDGQTVSLNMLDVALGVANGLGFEQRILQYVRDHVWGDVIIHYLQHHGLEHMVEQLSEPSVSSLALAQEIAV